MGYKIYIDAFEGPLDLLLHLIKESKVDIYDIKISEVTQQYLDYIHAMEDLQLEVASEYLVMAATFIEIKSKSLLPKQVVEIEDIYEEDTREALIQRLAQESALGRRGLLATFDPHPMTVLGAGMKGSLLTTTDEKLTFFRELQVEHVLLIPFDKKIAALNAEVFIRDFLIKKVGLSGLVVGFNHTLGHDRISLNKIQALEIGFPFDRGEISPFLRAGRYGWFSPPH